MQKNKFIIPILTFVITLTVLIVIKNPIMIISKNVIAKLNQTLLDEFVNEKFEFVKKAECKLSEDNFIIIVSTFYPKEGGDSIRQMNTQIDIFNEFVLGVFLIVALSISIPIVLWKRLVVLVASVSLGSLIYFLKIQIIIFDNYNYPEYNLIDFSTPIKEIIYFTNYLLNTVGTSINLVIAFIVVAIVILPYFNDVKKSLN